MILHDDGRGGVVCVGQPSHAWLSGQMARAWGRGAFTAPEPFEDVCLAVSQHDVGMAEWDLRPARDPDTGLPLPFLKMGEAEHLRLWRAAPGKVLAASPYAALLVSMHGESLMRHREPTPAVREYLDEQVAFQDGLVAALDADPVGAERNRQLLWALDHLSLALLVDGWSPAAVLAPGPREHRPELLVELRPGGRAIVDPWPFTSARVPLACGGRRLEEGRATEAELHAALDAAPWVRLTFELVPG